MTFSLYGITVVQTYIYYKRNERDPVYMKIIVSFQVEYAPTSQTNTCLF